ncbi:hypothetical protein [Xanthobacter autotrophicus]|uniref:hypothetical protein n=1 Tax=Xanthobacter autotrophicus TaxID=280 RepID=UPI003727C701
MVEDATEEMEPEETGPKSSSVWLDRIKEYKEKFQCWYDQCRNLDKLYSKHERADASDREYSIFWANLEVLAPAIYARPPVPVVAPRFKSKNSVATEASELLERGLVVTVEQSDVDGLMQEVRDEFLRYNRGSAWVRLEDDAGTEALAFDHVTFTDFAHELKRSWREVTWVARCAYLTKEEGEKRFGEAFEGVPRKKRDPNAVIPDTTDTAAIWEIWDKSRRMVTWVAEDFESVLDERPPFLELRGFWPCPRPAFGTTVPGSLLPVPDIRQYTDQIEEINEYTSRIAALAEAMRLRGFYQAGQGDISNAIEAAIRSTDDRAILIPISSMAALGNGSFKDAISWLPVGDVAALVKQLVELRRIVIEDVYQITGISDIVRGQSQASETLGAQQLKSQWGSIRIRKRQGELVRFARDLMRIAAEIMAENYRPETLAAMSQTDLPTAEQKAQVQQQIQAMQAPSAATMGHNGGPPVPGSQPAPQPPRIPPEVQREMKRMMERPTLEEVAQFLADDRARGFVIEIETDSTIQPDEDAEKQRRTEAITAIGGLIQQAAPMVMQMPAMAPFAGELLKFAAGAFRAARPLQMAIDDLVERMEQMAEAAQQPKPPPPPDPKIEAEKINLEATKVKAQADIAMAQMKIRQTQMDGQQAVAEHQMAMARPEGAAVEAGEPAEDQAHPAAMAQAVNNLAMALAAPKRVVRGPDGRVVGVEPVMGA